MANDAIDDIRPWRVTESRSILRDRWIDVRAETCVTASGAIVAPYYLLRPADWVHVLALDAAERVVMVRQYRHGLGRDSLEAPGGVIDPGDGSPEIAARRELLEETGYACGALMPAGCFSPNPANHTNTVHIFAARDAALVQAPQREVGESMRTELVAVTDLRRLALAGGLVHGLQIAAVMLALHALHIG